MKAIGLFFLVVAIVCAIQTPHVGIPVLLFILAGPAGKLLRARRRPTSPGKAPARNLSKEAA